MNMPTEEEHELIRNSVLLPALLKLIDGEEKKMMQAKSSMQRLYVRSARGLYELVQSDLATVRKELFRRKIKVWLQEAKPPYAIHYTYQMTGGFSAEVAMYPPEAKEKLGQLLAQYIKGTFTEIMKT